MEVLEAVVGEDVQLPCAAPPDHMVGWRRQTYGENEMFRELRERGEGGETSLLSTQPSRSATMALNKVTTEDSGTYLCYWDRDGKEQQQKVELRITGQCGDRYPSHATSQSPDSPLPLLQSHPPRAVWPSRTQLCGNTAETPPAALGEAFCRSPSTSLQQSCILSSANRIPPKTCSSHQSA